VDASQHLVDSGMDLHMVGRRQGGQLHARGAPQRTPCEPRQVPDGQGKHMVDGFEKHAQQLARGTSWQTHVSLLQALGALWPAWVQGRSQHSLDGSWQPLSGRWHMHDGRTCTWKAPASLGKLGTHSADCCRHWGPHFRRKAVAGATGHSACGVDGGRHGMDGRRCRLECSKRAVVR
jgi:hypothetical protein